MNESNELEEMWIRWDLYPLLVLVPSAATLLAVSKILTRIQLDCASEHLHLGVVPEEDQPTWKYKIIRIFLLAAKLAIATHLKPPTASTVQLWHTKYCNQYILAKLTINLNHMPSPRNGNTAS